MDPGPCSLISGKNPRLLDITIRIIRYAQKYNDKLCFSVRIRTNTTHTLYMFITVDFLIYGTKIWNSQEKLDAPVSQFTPAYPSAQKQLYESMLSLQIPPFRHGELSHSSISGENTKNLV